MLVFWDMLTNITHEIREKSHIITHFVLLSDNGGFPYHSMSKLYQNNSKTNMAIPHLFCMDEIHAFQRICLQVFKKIELLLHFRCEPP